jgi:hypothetical protein
MGGIRVMIMLRSLSSEVAMKCILNTSQVGATILERDGVGVRECNGVRVWPRPLPLALLALALALFVVLIALILLILLALFVLRADILLLVLRLLEQRCSSA